MSSATATTKPNIVFLFADQLHAFGLGCMGNPDVLTPNLDRLASEGVVFENTYSNWPVCTPFRGILMTGRYATATGVTGNAHRLPIGLPTLADRLGEAGYRTSYVGKWHLGGKGNEWVPPELRGGFAEFIGYQCYNDYLDQVWFFDEDGQKIVGEGHRTEVTTDLALQRLEGLKRRGEPFALFVSYQNPHYPVQPSPNCEALYRGRSITRRPNTIDVEPYTPTFSPPSPKPPERDPNFQKYGGDLDEYLRLYYAMVTQLDANVGRFLRALDQLGLSEETVVIFTSDHGDMQGSHGKTNKDLPWEESSRIPLIVRAPGGAAGVRRNELVSAVDFYPTCLDLAGAPPPPLDWSQGGMSFAPAVWRSDVTLPVRPVFCEGRRWCMIREGPLKLVASKPDLAPTDLYDLDKDPYELVNKVADEGHGLEKERLLQKLRTWYRRVLADNAMPSELR